MQGILLIGMSGAGKSTIGKKVAEILGFEFIDGDHEIQKVHDPQSFLDEYGDDRFIDMEAEIMVQIPMDKIVLSPGGSVVYSEKAMDYFSGCFKVYLNASFDCIKKHLASHNINQRFIVGLKDKGLQGVFEERVALYRKYADFTIVVDDKSPADIAASIVNAYGFRQLASKEKKKINYMSTNGISTATFSEALLQGLAPDRGLFVPEFIPKFSADEVSLMQHLEYPQLAFVLLRQFIDIPDADFQLMCRDAYLFGIPIEQHKDFFIARLDNGPSLSFKDFAAQLLSRMVSYAAGNRHITILTATSGDTGSAVAAAFSKIVGAKMIILMPKNEITLRQRKQMTTMGGNVVSVLVDGKFDDCQALAKKAFSEIPGLSSANSINIGRLLPQVVYYFYIYGKTQCNCFAVPSGNFGNLVAGLVARRMGLSAIFIAAVNENDEFPRFIQTGEYQPVVPSKRCISNAMNVGNPSNLARLFWLYGGIIDEKGTIKKMPDMNLMRAEISSISISDCETKKAIYDAYQKGILLEPHGAVGYAAVQKLKATRVVLLETAHPSKFSDELESLNVECDIPDSIRELDVKEEHYITISPNFEELKRLIDTVVCQHQITL